jgi:hypothetical protein
MELIKKEIKKASHNSTIGVILCRNKDRMMVEYMLSSNQDPLGVATFNRYEELQVWRYPKGGQSTTNVG